MQLKITTFCIRLLAIKPQDPPLLQPRFDITELRRKKPSEAVYKTVPTDESCSRTRTGKRTGKCY